MSSRYDARQLPRMKIIISVCAAVSAVLSVSSDSANLLSLMTIGCVVAALAHGRYAFDARFRARAATATGWLRGAIANVLVLVATGFLVLGDSFADPLALPGMLLTPLLVVVDWVCCGHSQANTRWWYPLTWALLDVGYLGLYFGARSAGWPELYPFLQQGTASFAPIVAVFLFVAVVIGYFLYGAGKVRGAVAAGAGGELEPEYAATAPR